MGAFEKQLELIRSDLQSGEQIIAALKGVDGGLTGAMAATDKRFVFFGSNGLKKERRSYPWQQVTSIEHEINRMSVDYLRVAVPSGTQKYLVSRKEETKAFVASALDALARSHAEVAGAGLDISDQLSKLGALRDAGVLTEEEFQAKKTELLGRL